MAPWTYLVVLVEEGGLRVGWEGEGRKAGKGILRYLDVATDHRWLGVAGAFVGRHIDSSPRSFNAADLKLEDLLVWKIKSDNYQRFDFLLKDSL